MIILGRRFCISQLREFVGSSTRTRAKTGLVPPEIWAGGGVGPD